MGLGPIKNGKYQPITPIKGSWADTVNAPKQPAHNNYIETQRGIKRNEQIRN